MKSISPSQQATRFKKSLLYLYLGINLLVGVVWLFPRMQVLILDLPDKSVIESMAVNFSRMMVLVFFVYFIGLSGSLAKSRMAKITFVFFGFLMVLAVVLDDYYFLKNMLLIGRKSIFQLSLKEIWGAMEFIPWAFWLAFNAWFLSVKQN